MQRLAPLQPNFVSVTYGADGSTRTRTHECVLRILRETNLVVAPHLTCVGASRAEVLKIAQDYWQQGMRHMVALRGDAPASSLSPDGRYRPHARGFAYASDLVRGTHRGRAIRALGGGLSGRPSGVRQRRRRSRELETQSGCGRRPRHHPVLLRHDVFLRYRDRCAAAGIRADIVPGILPITRFPQLLRFAERCGASVPAWLRRRFDGLDDDPETRRMIAANVAIEQVQRLREHGVDEFHFYTLNRAELTYAICHALGLRPRVIEAQVA